jgi:Zn-finger nucleic acid-binding protein
MGDTEEIIKCPACDNEMQKIFITDKGINIDVCSNGCGGIFFDNKEIQEFS